MPGKTALGERLDQAVREAIAARLPADAPRREKSRLAASILFFEHSIYPSAKVVLECTQQGSLTDINRDVQEFWRELRERSRVKLDVPGMPEDLQIAFGESLGQIWQLAVDKANESLDEVRAVAAAQIRDARQQAIDSQAEAQAALARIEEVERELVRERSRREVAEKTTEVQAAEISSLTASIEQWRVRLADEAGARRDAEARFSRDLQAEREDRQREAERYKGEVNFAKQQIEAARESERRAREEVSVELASYRQRLGRSEDARTAATELVAELRGAKTSLERRVEELQERLKEVARPEQRRATVPVKPLRRRTLRKG